jgi:hypothetical protein
MSDLLKKCHECGTKPATNKVYWEADDSIELYCEGCYKNYLGEELSWQKGGE